MAREKMSIKSEPKAEVEVIERETVQELQEGPEDVQGSNDSGASVPALPGAPGGDLAPIGEDGGDQGEDGGDQGGEDGKEAVGTRARRALMLKQFLPSLDWINKNVVAGGRGTKAVVGRIWGVATGFERKESEYQGRILQSIMVKGVFQSESFVTGELAESTAVFFPMAYAEKIAALFEADKTISVIEVDADIGLEATGKTIPYEWVVIAYLEGKEMEVLKRLKNSRARPHNAGKPMLPGTEEQRQLPAS